MDEPNPLIAARHARYRDIAEALEEVARDLDASGIPADHIKAHAHGLRHTVEARLEALAELD